MLKCDMGRFLTIFAAITLMGLTFSHSAQAYDPKKPRQSHNYLHGLTHFPTLFHIDGLSGSELADHDVMIVHFFATWCKDYPADRDVIEKLSKAYDIPVYGINTFEKESHEADTTFMTLKNPYTAWGKDNMAILRGAVRVNQALATMIVTKDKVIQGRWDHALNQEVLDSEVIPLLNKLKPEGAIETLAPMSRPVETP